MSKHTHKHHKTVQYRRDNWRRKVYQATGETHTTITSARARWRQLTRAQRAPKQENME